MCQSIPGMCLSSQCSGSPCNQCNQCSRCSLHMQLWTIHHQAAWQPLPPQPPMATRRHRKHRATVHSRRCPDPMRDQWRMDTRAILRHTHHMRHMHRHHMRYGPFIHRCDLSTPWLAGLPFNIQPMQDLRHIPQDRTMHPPGPDHIRNFPDQHQLHILTTHDLSIHTMPGRAPDGKDGKGQIRINHCGHDRR